MKEIQRVNFASEFGESQPYTPAKDGDAGIDLLGHSIEIKGKCFDVEKDIWSSIDYIEYDTGFRISPEHKDVFAFALSNSRVTKMNLIQGNSVGTIDNGYRGSIRMRYKYIFQPEDLVVVDGKVYGKINRDKIFSVGQVVGQIVFGMIIPVKLTRVHQVGTSERGEGGFGSTQK